MKRVRFRSLVIIGGSAVSLAFLVLSQPELGLIRQLPFGGETMEWLGSLSRIFVAVLLIWLLRKALHDYVEADMKDLFGISRGSPEGAGRALQALALVFLGLCILAAPLVSRAETYPPAAEKHLPALRAAVASHWPSHPMPAYFGGLMEHESCPSWNHRFCWSTRARLKTHREEGCGPMQVTRAWHPDGTLRFDTLADMRRKHASLAEWSWANCYERGDLQMQAVVLLSREHWELLPMVPDEAERLAMTDLSYNQGPGRTRADRRACSLTAGCNPNLYFGHVERTCTASRAALYGRRSACDISRHHVPDALRRARNYVAVLGG